MIHLEIEGILESGVVMNIGEKEFSMLLSATEEKGVSFVASDPFEG
jgi:hypothetical protein